MIPFGVSGALQTTSNFCGSSYILEALLMFGLLGTKNSGYMCGGFQNMIMVFSEFDSGVHIIVDLCIYILQC